MRCKACDALLTDDELKTKDGITNELLDTCNDCLLAQGSRLTNEYSTFGGDDDDA